MTQSDKSDIMAQTTEIDDNQAKDQATLADHTRMIKRVALLGAPNCGKSSLFNALTGGRAKVANYPGVTVEYRKGLFTLANNIQAELLDLPGVYGASGHSLDERVAIDAVRGHLKDERRPDAIIFVMDAVNIQTQLHNVLQAKAYGLPMILVLNMMDMARRDGIIIDREALSEEGVLIWKTHFFYCPA